MVNTFEANVQRQKSQLQRDLFGSLPISNSWIANRIVEICFKNVTEQDGVIHCGLHFEHHREIMDLLLQTKPKSPNAIIEIINQIADIVPRWVRFHIEYALQYGEETTENADLLPVVRETRSRWIALMTKDVFGSSEDHLAPIEQASRKSIGAIRESKEFDAQYGYLRSLLVNKEKTEDGLEGIRQKVIADFLPSTEDNEQAGQALRDADEVAQARGRSALAAYNAMRGQTPDFPVTPETTAANGLQLSEVDKKDFAAFLHWAAMTRADLLMLTAQRMLKDQEIFGGLSDVQDQAAILVTDSVIQAAAIEFLRKRFPGLFAVDTESQSSIQKKWEAGNRLGDVWDALRNVAAATTINLSEETAKPPEQFGGHGTIANGAYTVATIENALVALRNIMAHRQMLVDRGEQRFNKELLLPPVAMPRTSITTLSPINEDGNECEISCTIANLQPEGLGRGIGSLTGHTFRQQNSDAMGSVVARMVRNHPASAPCLFQESCIPVEAVLGKDDGLSSFLRVMAPGQATDCRNMMRLASNAGIHNDLPKLSRILENKELKYFVLSSSDGNTRIPSRVYMILDAEDAEHVPQLIWTPVPEFLKEIARFVPYELFSEKSLVASVVSGKEEDDDDGEDPPSDKSPEPSLELELIEV